MKLPRCRSLHWAAGAVALPFAPRVGRERAYPARWIVGYPAGGDTDIFSPNPRAGR
jgi:hypothetical protein